MLKRRAARYPNRIPKVLAPYLRKTDDGDCPEHRAWIRQQPCLINDVACGGQKHAHHVRSASTAGVGLKPPDSSCVPFCAFHHDSVHRNGVKTFEAWHEIDLAAEADKLAARSPVLRRKERSGT